MEPVRLADAQSRLPSLVDAVTRGEEVIITRDDVPVARLTSAIDTNAPTLKRPSLREHQPSSLGRVLRGPDSEDLLAEMLDDRG
jgi:prevent-host-death family protein